MPNPTPSNKATEKKTIVHTMLFQLIRYTQAESRKKLNTTRYSPAEITCVILPLSTIFQENIREIAIPIAMKVKKKPVVALIPICLAYIAT